MFFHCGHGRTTTAIKIPLLCFVYLDLVSLNGGHNYFKFQSYGTVTHDKYAQAFKQLSCRVGLKKKALSGVCSSSLRLPNAKPAKIKTNRKH